MFQTKEHNKPRKITVINRDNCKLMINSSKQVIKMFIKLREEWMNIVRTLRDRKYKKVPVQYN